METVLGKFVLLLLIMCFLLSCSYAQRNSQRKDELIQDTVRKFLGVKSDERTAVAGKGQSLPPQYMMDLYEKYRSGHTPMQGNTVRSILAMRDTIADADMLIFNLTALKLTEQILQSKLYLLKRKKHKGGKKREQSSFRLNVGCLPNMTSNHHIDISLVRQKPEWHSYDISESVVLCRQTRKGKDSLLGLTLQIKRPKGNHRLVAFKRLIKSNSQPFVLIFSEDSQNQTNIPAMTRHDELGDLLRARANQEGLLPEGLRLPKTPDRNYRHRGRRSLDDDSHIVQNDSTLKHHKQSSTTFLPDYFLRKHIDAGSEKFEFNISVRSDFVNVFQNIMTKLLYDLNVNKPLHLAHVTKTLPLTINHQRLGLTEATVLDKHYNLSNNNTFQEVLHSLQQMLKQNGKSQNEKISFKRSTRSIADTLRYSAELNVSTASESTVKTSQVIDQNLDTQKSNLYPKSRRRNKKRKKHEKSKRNKKKRHRNGKLPIWWTTHDTKLHSQDFKQMCQRKSLEVDFAKLGWDEWIITPKSFNAHYCEGSCAFPLIKHTETSNHAAVQSLIHALGSNVNIPTPCCVPSVTKPLTLLYFDENGNFILRRYPDMIVEKCGCR